MIDVMFDSGLLVAFTVQIDLLLFFLIRAISRDVDQVDPSLLFVEPLDFGLLFAAICFVIFYGIPTMLM